MIIEKEVLPAMRTININTTYNQVTPIPNAFIDDYLPKANAMYSVIYLYFYRHCLFGACTVTTASVADSFGILETDVVNCLKYWEKTGLIRLSGTGEEYSIEFVPPEAAAAARPPASAAPHPPANVVPITGASKPADAPAQTTPLPPPPKAVSLEPRPVYTVDELEIYKAESSDVARLFSAAEQAFGTLHHYNDLCTVFGLYDWLRLPLDVIEKLFGYCAAGSERRSVRYAERIAVDWAERGISDSLAAEERISMLNDGYRSVMKALGRGGRAPAPKEQQYLDKWLYELALPLPVVLEACDRTIMATDKRVFAYCDKILAGWHKKGVASLEDIKLADSEFNQNARGAAAAPRPAAARKPTRFANFKQREWDFEEVERVERAFLELGLRKG